MSRTTNSYKIHLYPVVNNKIQSIICTIADISLDEFFDERYKDCTYEYLAYNFNPGSMSYDEWLIVKSKRTRAYFALKAGSIAVESFPALYPDLTPAKFYFDIFPDFFQKKAPH